MAKKGFTEGYKTYDPEKEGYGNPHKWRKIFSDRMTGEEADRILGKAAKERKETPWSILQINEGATQVEIKAAYRKLIAVWHPDVCSHPDAEEMSKKIIAAYHKLKI